MVISVRLFKCKRLVTFHFLRKKFLTNCFSEINEKCSCQYSISSIWTFGSQEEKTAYLFSSSVVLHPPQIPLHLQVLRGGRLLVLRCFGWGVGRWRRRVWWRWGRGEGGRGRQVCRFGYVRVQHVHIGLHVCDDWISSYCYQNTKTQSHHHPHRHTVDYSNNIKCLDIYQYI